ncbi:aminopeptidase P family protein [Methylophilaceae bacterium]|nr:aminopeptidase P family protein [Methylophilaceae bacterium]
MKSKYNEFCKRRSLLQSKIGDGVAIIFNTEKISRNRDSHFKFRSDSYFHYLSGFPESDAVLFVVGGKTPFSILFCQQKNKEKEIWDGFIYGPIEAKETFLIEEAHPLEKMNEIAIKLIANRKKIFILSDNTSKQQKLINKWINFNKQQKRAGIRTPEIVVDLASILDPMRVVKSPYEIKLMQKSADIASEAHIQGMRNVLPGKYEYQVEGEILNHFIQNGAGDPAYQSIVAGGKNACTLHYITNNQKMISGDLLLVDAGCEYELYASDITRTYPINGKFTSAQKNIYEMVLLAQKKAIEEAKSGKLFNSPHKAALSVIIDGLIDLKLCNGSRDEIEDKETYKNFFMHRTSHWLGLDVHDAGNYVDTDGQSIKLIDGNVLTIEPGCYIQPSQDTPKEFWGIGVRIEDDVLINKNNPVVLTEKAPKEISDLEMFVGKKNE